MEGHCLTWFLYCINNYLIIYIYIYIYSYNVHSHIVPYPITQFCTSLVRIALNNSHLLNADTSSYV